jgi:hypothetical protein
MMDGEAMEIQNEGDRSHVKETVPSMIFEIR